MIQPLFLPGTKTKLIVTANDFHKAIRKISEARMPQMPQLQLRAIARELQTESSDLAEHLQTLYTLGLIRYHDEEKEIFSLTESGWLANLP